MLGAQAHVRQFTYIEMQYIGFSTSVEVNCTCVYTQPNMHQTIFFLFFQFLKNVQFQKISKETDCHKFTIDVKLKKKLLLNKMAFMNGNKRVVTHS